MKRCLPPLTVLAAILVLALCGKDDAWLNKTLRKEKLSSPREVFLLTLDEQGQVLCVKKEGQR